MSGTVSNAPFIASRRVGAAEVTVIDDGGLLWAPTYPVAEAEWRAAMPEADESGRIWLGLNVILVRLGEALVVIDPGMDDPDSEWQRDRPRVWATWEVTRTAGMAAALASLGIAPEDVTHVVITHPHGDHYAGVTVDRDGERRVRFPRARHYLGRADWEGNPARGQAASDMARLELVAQAGLLELVDGEREIVPGLKILAAPGETPGHCVVRLESDGEVFYGLGDVIHHPCEMAHPEWTPPGRTAATLIPTRERMFAAAASEEALVVNAHDRFPPWSGIVAADGGYAWQRR